MSTIYSHSTPDCVSLIHLDAARRRRADPDHVGSRLDGQHRAVCGTHRAGDRALVCSFVDFHGPDADFNVAHSQDVYGAGLQVMEVSLRPWVLPDSRAIRWRKWNPAVGASRLIRSAAATRWLCFKGARKEDGGRSVFGGYLLGGYRDQNAPICPVHEGRRSWRTGQEWRHRIPRVRRRYSYSRCHRLCAEKAGMTTRWRAMALRH